MASTRMTLSDGVLANPGPRPSRGRLERRRRVTADGPLRVFELLHNARRLLLNLGGPGGFDITPWADRVQLIDADYVGLWELLVLGVVSAPTAVLVRPDGYVAWSERLPTRACLERSPPGSDRPRA